MEFSDEAFLGDRDDLFLHLSECFEALALSLQERKLLIEHLTPMIPIFRMVSQKMADHLFKSLELLSQPSLLSYRPIFLEQFFSFENLELLYRLSHFLKGHPWDIDYSLAFLKHPSLEAYTAVEYWRKSNILSLLPYPDFLTDASFNLNNTVFRLLRLFAAHSMLHRLLPQSLRLPTQASPETQATALMDHLQSLEASITDPRVSEVYWEPDYLWEKIRAWSVHSHSESVSGGSDEDSLKIIEHPEASYLFLTAILLDTLGLLNLSVFHQLMEAKHPKKVYETVAYYLRFWSKEPTESILTQDFLGFIFQSDWPMNFWALHMEGFLKTVLESNMVSTLEEVFLWFENNPTTLFNADLHGHVDPVRTLARYLSCSLSYLEETQLFNFFRARIKEQPHDLGHAFLGVYFLYQKDLLDSEHIEALTEKKKSFDWQVDQTVLILFHVQIDPKNILHILKHRERNTLAQVIKKIQELGKNNDHRFLHIDFFFESLLASKRPDDFPAILFSLARSQRPPSDPDILSILQSSRPKLYLEAARSGCLNTLKKSGLISELERAFTGLSFFREDIRLKHGKILSAKNQEKLIVYGFEVAKRYGLLKHLKERFTSSFLSSAEMFIGLIMLDQRKILDARHLKILIQCASKSHWPCVSLALLNSPIPNTYVRLILEHPHPRKLTVSLQKLFDQLKHSQSPLDVHPHRIQKNSAWGRCFHSKIFEPQLLHLIASYADDPFEPFVQAMAQSPFDPLLDSQIRSLNILARHGFISEYGRLAWNMNFYQHLRLMNKYQQESPERKSTMLRSFFEVYGARLSVGGDPLEILKNLSHPPFDPMRSAAESSNIDIGAPLHDAPLLPDPPEIQAAPLPHTAPRPRGRTVHVGDLLSNTRDPSLSVSRLRTHRLGFASSQDTFPADGPSSVKISTLLTLAIGATALGGACFLAYKVMSFLGFMLTVMGMLLTFLTIAREVLQKPQV